MAEPVRKVVIAGGGTAGWMTAAWFSRVMRDAFEEIVLVESEEIGTVGVGEATTPYIHVFNRFLGLDENDFVRFTRATFKLGIEFTDWGHVGNSYHHSFGPHGREYGALPFHAVWLRHVLENGDEPLDAYNLQTLASLRGKFMRPARSNSPLADIAYAFQFDASLYAQYLRRLSEKAGVRRIEGRIEDVRLDDAGFIRSLSLDGGRSVEGDLFIDCTGFRALLLGQVLKVGFVDWSHWLPCDRAWAVPTARDGAPPPFTRSRALSAGWQWRIPLQHRDGNGHVFASAFVSEDAALQQLIDNLDGGTLAEPRLLRFTTGRRERFWEKNCVAVGLSAGFLEPLESTSIMLIQNAITRLQYLFPDKAFEPIDIKTYNDQMIREYEDIRDFLILHYHVNRRDDAPFWQYCAGMEVPEQLTDRIRLFESRGRIPPDGDQQFRTPSWLAVMWGQGLRPRAPDPLTLSLKREDVARWLADTRQTIRNCCDYMPSHEDFLAELGKPSVGTQRLA